MYVYISILGVRARCRRRRRHNLANARLSRGQRAPRRYLDEARGAKDNDAAAAAARGASDQYIESKRRVCVYDTHDV